MMRKYWPGYVIVVAVLGGIMVRLSPKTAVLGVIVIGVVLMAWGLRWNWITMLWGTLFGLALWSYGFNTIPVVGSVALVHVLLGGIIVLSIRKWRRFLAVPTVRKARIFIALLSVVVILRLIVDFPRFGALAIRDVTFAFEMWILFPAIVAGYALGQQKLNKQLMWFFGVTTLWFLLSPMQSTLEQISPMVGISHPVPLFSFRTAAFLSVPAFFWFLWYRRGTIGIIGAVLSLVVLLFKQSRGGYLALLFSTLLISFLHPDTLPKWGKYAVALGSILFVVLPFAGRLPGRLGAPVGVDTAAAQLGTLLGREGPGAGSYQGRLTRWPRTVQKVFSEPLGPILGIGFGQDLFGLVIEGGIIVRKPHNDFLELWARSGILGLALYVGLLITFTMWAVRICRKDIALSWVLALHISFLFRTISQNALGFAYTIVVYLGLLGLALGAFLRTQQPEYRNGALDIVADDKSTYGP